MMMMKKTKMKTILIFFHLNVQPFGGHLWLTAVEPEGHWRQLDVQIRFHD
jgi:hypothetical protein